MKSRIFYLDNLKVFVTILVILHHSALTYSNPGYWYFFEETADLIPRFLLIFFVIVNQSFFMGTLFFIAGFFTSNSFNKKGPFLFLAGKTIRLGVPLILYTFLIDPLIYFFLKTDRELSFINFYTDKIKTFNISPGPTWFLFALLIFYVSYTLYRIIKQKVNNIKISFFPSNQIIILILLFVGFLTFAVRIIFPVDEKTLGLRLGYFPSYILFFCLGIINARHNWIEKTKTGHNRFWFSLVTIFIFIFPFVLYSQKFNQGGLVVFGGGFNFQSLFYAMWEPLVGFGIILILLNIFRKRLNYTNKIMKILTTTAYTTYIIHPPFVVTTGYFLSHTFLPVQIKFILLGIFSITVSFSVAYLIKTILFTFYKSAMARRKHSLI